MAFDGNGTFNQATTPVVSGTVISSTNYNSQNTDYNNGLSNVICKDGQTTITANLPMSAYRHTGVGNAVARNDYAAAGQVQDGDFIWCGTAGGTADALTLTTSPAIAAYKAGQVFRFIAGASPNTGAATVTVSGLGAKAIQSAGAALSAGAIVAGREYQILYDGTQFQLSAWASGAVVAASETVAGILEIATAAETTTGTDDTRAITPKKLTEFAPATATLDTAADEILIRDATDSKIKRAAFPAAAKFSAWKNGTDQTGILSATYTKVTFGTEYFDIGGYYDTSTSRYTPPAGYYHFTATVYHTANVVDQQEYIAAIYKNGVSVLEFSLRASGTGPQLAAVFGTLQANGTDYFEAYTYGGGAGNKTVSGGFYTRFEAFAV
jgi:hypothetical protein